MTFVKINVDKVSLTVLFKSMAKINDKMNETSFVHATTKHRLKIELQGRAAEFCTPYGFSDMSSHGCVTGPIMS